MQVSIDTLARVAGSSAAALAEWPAPLNAAMSEFAISTPMRQAAFLAQVVHESARFTSLVENLNYSAGRLAQVWPHRFYLPPELPGTRANALAYAHQPERLANLVYANRMGNGPPASGDGWRFRGRGLKQLTGRDNYTAASKALKVDLLQAPDQLLAPLPAARSAAWYWASIGGNALADSGTEEDFETLTRRINGGLTGLEVRTALWRNARKILGDLS